MSMQGKVCVVTGANTGIGKATAEGLARDGAIVVLACRDPERGRAALEEVRNRTGSKDLHLMQLDLASQSSIRKFAVELGQKFDRLDVLVNNAAIIPSKRQLTADGIEMQFGVNHLGPFLLTELVLPLLEKSAPSRIVVVSSSVHRGAKIDFDDLQATKSYSGMSAYGRSKMANMLFVHRLAKDLAGRGVTVNALHPGVISTELARDMPAPFRWMASLFFKSPEKGARTSLYLATSSKVEGVSGRYFEDAKEVAPDPAARDDAAADRLWAISKELTNTSRASDHAA